MPLLDKEGTIYVPSGKIVAAKTFLREIEYPISDERRHAVDEFRSLGSLTLIYFLLGGANGTMATMKDITYLEVFPSAFTVTILAEQIQPQLDSISKAVFIDKVAFDECHPWIIYVCAFYLVVWS